MTAPARPMPDDAFAPDPERLLEAYAASVRIVASPQLLRRLNQSVAEERVAAEAGLVARASALVGRGRRDRNFPDARPVAARGSLLRLPSLALLLLLLLSVGAAVGGAGAMMISAIESRQDGSQLPARPVVPGPLSPFAPEQPAPAAPSLASTIRHGALLRGPMMRVTERLDPSPGPEMRLSVHPQHRPAARHHRALARWRAHVAAAREARRAASTSLQELSGGQGRVGCTAPAGADTPDDGAVPGADAPRAGPLSLPRSHTGVCAF